MFEGRQCFNLVLRESFSEIVLFVFIFADIRQSIVHSFILIDRNYKYS